MASEYNVNITPAAVSDLDGIYSYIADTLRAEQAAQNLMREIYDKIISLEEMPYRFGLSRDITLRKKGYRVFIVKNYVGLFLIDESNKKVIVARIFHGSMNYAKYL